MVLLGMEFNKFELGPNRVWLIVGTEEDCLHQVTKLVDADTSAQLKSEIYLIEHDVTHIWKLYEAYKIDDG